MASGVPVRVIADIVGHASTRLTSDTYSHVSETMARDALAHLRAAFGSSNS